MAIDTRDKRGSVIGLGMVSVLPLADGSIGQADRQQVAHMYIGVLADAPVIVVPGSIRVSLITLQPSIDATVKVA